MKKKTHQKVTAEQASEARKKILKLQKEIKALEKLGNLQNVLGKDKITTLREVYKGLFKTRKSKIKFTIEVEAELCTHLDYYGSGGSSVYRDTRVRIINQPLGELDRGEINVIENAISDAINDISYEPSLNSMVCLSKEEKKLVDEEKSFRNQIKEIAKITKISKDNILDAIE